MSYPSRRQRLNTRRNRRRAQLMETRRQPPHPRGPLRQSHLAEVRRARRRVLLCLYSVLTVELVAAALTSPALAIKRVKLTGATGLSGDEAATIVRVSTPSPGTNWLRAPVTTIRQRLCALPWVYSAEIARRFPNELTARVQARVPVVLVQCDTGLFETDAAGVPIRPARPGSASRWPIIVMQNLRAVRPGVAVDRPALLQSMQILETFRGSSVVRIAKIEVDQSDNICLNMVDGIRVQLGQTDAMPDKLALLQRLYEREPGIAQRLVAVNLTSPSWPACTPRAASLAQASVPPAPPTSGALR